MAYRRGGNNRRNRGHGGHRGGQHAGGHHGGYQQQQGFGQQHTGFGAPAAGGFGAGAAAGAGSGQPPIVSSWARNPCNDFEVALGNPSDSISSLAFANSPGVDMIMVGSWDKKIRCYEVTKNAQGRPAGAEPRVVVEAGGPVLDVAAGPDAATVFGASCDKTVAMWNLTTGAKQQVAAHDTAVKAVEWVANRNLIATGGWDRRVRYWDPRAPSGVPTLNVDLPERVYSLSVMPNEGNPLAAVALAGNRILSFDLRSPDRIWHNDDTKLQYQLRSIKCAPTGRGFTTGSIEGRCEVRHDLWASADGRTKNDFTFRCHRVKALTYPVNAIAYHPYYQTAIATAGADGSYTFWDVAKRFKLWPLDEHYATVRRPEFGINYLPITCCSFNATGDLFAYGCSYDWHRGYASHPATPENYLYLRIVTPADVTPKK